MPETVDGLLEQFTDLKYIFTTNHVPHFKSRRCIELDQSMGDTATNISDHEISIMLQLSKHIVDETELLVEFSHLGKKEASKMYDQFSKTRQIKIHKNSNQSFSSF